MCFHFILFKFLSFVYFQLLTASLNIVKGLDSQSLFSLNHSRTGQILRGGPFLVSLKAAMHKIRLTHKNKMLMLNKWEMKKGVFA